jgi:Nif-specific regulatory protein
MLFRTVAVQTSVTLGYENCAVFLLEGEKLVLKAAHRFPGKLKRRTIAMGEGVTGRCALTEEIVNIGDTAKCPFYIPSGLRGVRSEIAIPIVFSRQLLGVLTIESTRRNAFGAEDELVLRILGSQLGVAIRNAKLTRAKQTELDLLHRVGLKIVAKIDLDRLLRTIVKLISNNLGFKYCAVFLPVGGAMVLKAQSHFPRKVLGLEIPFG